MAAAIVELDALADAVRAATQYDDLLCGRRLRLADGRPCKARFIGRVHVGVLGSTIGLRETLFVGAAGSSLAVLPIVLSPIRSLREMPEPEEVLPTIVEIGRA